MAVLASCKAATASTTYAQQTPAVPDYVTAVMEAQRRIEDLERENRRLREQIKQLEAKMQKKD